MKRGRKRRVTTVGKDASIVKLRDQLGDANAELVRLRADAMASREAEMRFAREHARRTDQFRALLQVSNLLLAVAAGEIIDFNPRK